MSDAFHVDAFCLWAIRYTNCIARHMLLSSQAGSGLPGTRSMLRLGPDASSMQTCSHVSGAGVVDAGG